MNIYFVRHGESVANEQKRFAGVWDVPLNEKGVMQAQQAGEKLKNLTFEGIYASDLKRAFHTAEHIAAHHKTDITPMPAFREVNFGSWEGKTYAEIKALDQDGLDKWIEDYKTFAAHGGESVCDVYKRTSEAYEALVKKHGKNSNANILIVAHGGVIQTLLSHICYGDLSGYWRFGVDNCGISRVEYVMGYAVVKTLNA